MADRKVGDLTFGMILAFIAPGFLGFVAASYHLPSARAWIEAAQNSEQSVGIFLFAALASVTSGVIISGLRDLAADPLFCSGCLGLVGKIELPKAGFRKLSEPSVLTAFEATIENYYRYYQFYANTAVAIALLTLSRIVAVCPPVWPKGWWIITILLMILLGISAYRSLKRYAISASEILS
jgi:hypothetical protein